MLFSSAAGLLGNAGQAAYAAANAEIDELARAASSAGDRVVSLQFGAWRGAGMVRRGGGEKTGGGKIVGGEKSGGGENGNVDNEDANSLLSRMERSGMGALEATDGLSVIERVLASASASKGKGTKVGQQMEKDSARERRFFSFPCFRRSTQFFSTSFLSLSSILHQKKNQFHASQKGGVSEALGDGEAEGKVRGASGLLACSSSSSSIEVADSGASGLTPSSSSSVAAADRGASGFTASSSFAAADRSSSGFTASSSSSVAAAAAAAAGESNNIFAFCSSLAPASLHVSNLLSGSSAGEKRNKWLFSASSRPRVVMVVVLTVEVAAAIAAAVALFPRRHRPR